MAKNDELGPTREERETEIIKKIGITFAPRIPNHVIHISDHRDWERITEEAENYHVPIVVLFSATWCMSCLEFAPTFQKIRAEFAQKMYFVRVDIDEVPDLGYEFGIVGVPSVSVLFDGREIEVQLGATSETSFRFLIQRALQKCQP